MESSDIPFSTISSASKCKCDKESVIVEALWELRTSHMEIELSKQKIAFIQHQEKCSVKDEERNAAENFLQRQEEACKAAEHIFKKLLMDMLPSSMQKSCSLVIHINTFPIFFDSSEVVVAIFSISFHNSKCLLYVDSHLTQIKVV